MDTTAFIFKGFLPRENKEKKLLVDDLIDRKETLIFYEAPHRLIETLEFLLQSFGNREISICRELTKIHEEILRLYIGEAIIYYKEKEPRGEYVLVLKGKSEEEIQKVYLKNTLCCLHSSLVLTHANIDGHVQDC